MMPVMMMRMGATSAESTPPAPKRDQKIGSWDRFMSGPPHDDVDQNGSTECREEPARGDDGLRQGTAADADVRGGLRCDLPPRKGVVADRQQRQPMKEDGHRAR